MLRRRILRATLLGSSVLAISAAHSAPPLRQNVDANGVDVVLAQIPVNLNELSIGDADGGFTFVETLSSNENWSDNWTGGLLYQVLGGVGTYTVINGTTSEQFTASGTTYVSVKGDGSTLTSGGSSLTFTASDGTITVYSNIADFPITGYACGDSQSCTLPVKTTKPNGITYTYTWSTVDVCNGSGNIPPDCPTGGHTYYRLSRIDSSTGYRLGFGYATSVVHPGTSPSADWFRRTAVGASNTLVACTSNCPSVTYTGPAPKTVTDNLGRMWKVQEGGPAGVSVQRPSDTGYSYTYVISGTTMTVTTPAGVWHYSWSDSGSTRTMTITDPLSHVQVITSDTSLDRIKSIKDALNRTTTYQYDTNGRLIYFIPPEGTITSGTPTAGYTHYVYDARGNVTSTTQVSKTAGSPANIVTSAAYPTSCTSAITCNKPTSTTDARGNETDYTYDPTHGGVLTVTQPAPATGAVRPQVRLTYSKLDNSGAVTTAATGMYKLTQASACQTTASCAGGADEVKRTVTYGSNLLPISVSQGSGNGTLTVTNSATYDQAGNVATTTDPLSHVTAYFFDIDREPLGKIGPDPDGTGVLKMRATRLTYNPDGLITLTEQGTATANTLAAFNAMTTLQQLATAYDSADRRSSISAQAGGTTYAVLQYGYDAASRLQCTAQRMKPPFSSLPASACSTESAASTGSFGPDRITYNTYDSADELTKVTTGYGVTTANGFPATLQRDETTYTWSNNGKVKTLVDAKSNLTTYVYDGFDRMSQTQYPSPTTPGSSNAADYEQLGYDPAGNVTGRRLRGSTLAAGSYDIGYGYDALNRQSSKTLPSPEHGITYAYDNFGQPRTITGATTLGYIFDALGRETSETQAYGGVAYQYDLASRRTRLTWQDGTYLTYDYDNADEMTDIKESGSTVLAGFTYDDLGERKIRTLANGTSTTYGYDPISRLTSLALAGGTNANTATLSSYSPAGEIGARTNSNDTFAWTAGINGSKAYTVNGLNQFATIAGATQGYDARGNLTSSGGVSYAYTSKNLLKTAGSSTLFYDPVGRLHEYDAPTATRFVYDGGMISEELNASGTVLRRYAFGPAGDEPIVWYEGSGTGTKRYLDQDERGSVTRITDGSGATLAVNSYDEYGIPGSTNPARFGYTGQAWLAEIGLAYYRARIYSPTLGRFLQTDPIGYAGGPNLYNYVGSDPINGVDPLGTFCADGAAGKTDEDCKGHGGLKYPDIVVDGGGGSGGGGGTGSSGWGGRPGRTPPDPVQAAMDAAAADSGRCSSCMSGDNETEQPAENPAASLGILVVAPEEEAAGVVGEEIVVTASERGWLGRIIDRIFGRSACFAAGTLVQTDHGLRAIETIRSGDMVLSRDEKTGATGYRRVTAVKVPTEDELYTVDLDVPAAGVSSHHADFEATATHPWRSVDGHWVATAQLRHGMKLVRSEGAPALVDAVQDSGHKAPTYNLTVEKYHTYFVGKDHIWVHNACSPDLRDLIESEIQNSQFKGGRVVGQVDGPTRISNLDPSLGSGQVRYNVDFADEFGNITNYSVNYDPETGEFGIIKPSSGR